jgi:hypothetical protein
MIPIRHTLAAAIVLAAAAAAPRPAVAETVNCTAITSLPATIATQGVYCLKQNLVVNLATGAAITVTVNNVTLDCNEFKIGNLQAGVSTQAVGVAATNRLNIKIRGCGIRGFRRGVSLMDGLYVVENSRFDNNWEAAIAVSGDGSTVRGNEIVDTGGSTVVGAETAYGIWIEDDADVIDNLVSQVAATLGGGGDAYGIFATGNDAGTILDNRVRNLAPDGAGRRRGIWAEASNRISLENNTVVMNGGDLLDGEAGIRCGDGLLLMNGASRDNTVLGVGALGEAFALLNCASAGGDYVNPL